MSISQRIKEWFENFRKKDRSEEQVEVEIPDHFSWKALLKFMGPGMLVSIAYLDPGNLLSDIQSGAAFNYRLIWILCLSTFLGFLMQILASRLGIVTGKHLALMCREEYGAKTFTTISLWLLSEVAIIASDVPEVVGSSFGMNLLFGIPLWIGVIIVSLNTFILLGVQYFGIRKLEILISILIGIIGVCFVIEASLSHIEFGIPHCPTDEEWKTLVNCTGIAYCPSNYCGSFWGGFIPRITFDTKMMLIATSLIGAVVMPHNLFLHSALVLSRKVSRGNEQHVKWADIYSTIECGIAIGISCIINLSVMIVAASVFFPNESNKFSVPTDLSEIGFSEASELLETTLGGRTAAILFGIALLASGQSSTITGTYAGQFVMEGFIEIKIQLWLRNILTRTVAILPSLLICVLAGKSGANTLIIVSSVILSFQLPFALIPLLKFTSSEIIMGVHKNSKMMQFTCTFLTLVVLSANFFLIYTTIFTSLSGAKFIGAAVMGGIISVGYFGSLCYLALRPIKHARIIFSIDDDNSDQQILMRSFDISDNDEDDEDYFLNEMDDEYSENESNREYDL